MTDNLVLCQSAVCLTLEQATNVYGMILASAVFLFFIALIDMGSKQ